MTGRNPADLSISTFMRNEITTLRERLGKLMGTDALGEFDVEYVSNVNRLRALELLWMLSLNPRPFPVLIEAIKHSTIRGFTWVEGSDVRVNEILSALLSGHALAQRFIPWLTEMSAINKDESPATMRFKVVVAYAALSGHEDDAIDFMETRFDAVSYEEADSILSLMYDYIDDENEDKTPFCWQYQLNGFGQDQ